MASRQYAIGAGLLCFLSACSVLAKLEPTLQFQDHVEARQNRSFDRPEINPSPQKVLTVQGTKDPRIEVWFRMGYQTTNDACRSQTLSARIVGAPDIWETVYDSARVRAGTTEYSLHFFIDRYLPGRCNWKPFLLEQAFFEPSVSAGPADMGPVVVIRSDGRHSAKFARVCHRAMKVVFEKEVRYLACPSTSRITNEDLTMSIDGGVVVNDLALGPDQ